MMSALPSLSTILSLLSLFTTVFALARVGAAAFSANQSHSSTSSSNNPSKSSHSSKSRNSQPVLRFHFDQREQMEMAAAAEEIVRFNLANARSEEERRMFYQQLNRGRMLLLSSSGASSRVGPFEIGRSLLGYGYKGNGNEVGKNGYRTGTGPETGGDPDPESGLRSIRVSTATTTSTTTTNANENGNTTMSAGGDEREREFSGMPMPSSSVNGHNPRKFGTLFRIPSTPPDEPMSMAKLIMMKHHLDEKRSRSQTGRRPPGLPSLPSSRSRLVEEV